jgi:hypothetical protein
MIQELKKNEIYSPNVDGYFMPKDQYEAIRRELSRHYKKDCNYRDECIEMIAEKFYDCNNFVAVGNLKAAQPTNPTY